jgi:hypothetical protein
MSTHDQVAVLEWQIQRNPAGTGGPAAVATGHSRPIAANPTGDISARRITPGCAQLANQVRLNDRAEAPAWAAAKPDTPVSAELIADVQV